MGTPQPANVKLVSRFIVTPLNLNLDQLIASAHDQNPSVVALRSREHVSALNVKR